MKGCSESFEGLIVSLGAGVAGELADLAGAVAGGSLPERPAAAARPLMIFIVRTMPLKLS
jgi:hypothetical protein